MIMDWASNLSEIFLMNWQKKACYLFLILLSVGLVVGKIGREKQRFNQDYLLLKEIFTKWEHGEPPLEETVSKVKGLLKKYPDLSTQYDPILGQHLLATFSPKEAAPFIDRTVLRTERPYFSDYARTSLKMSEGRLEEALEDAIDLKKRVSQDGTFWEKSKQGSILFSFNLIRIAVLSQMLEKSEEERKAWEEIEQYGAGKGCDGAFTGAKISEAFKEAFTHFSAQEITLLDYIQTRKQQLATCAAK